MDLGKGGHGFKVEERVAVGFDAGHFKGGSCHRGPLVGEVDFGEAIGGEGKHFAIADELSEGGDLQSPAGGVVVFGIAFLCAVMGSIDTIRSTDSETAARGAILSHIRH